MGFGMKTVMLNIHNAGFFPWYDDPCMGLCYGGLAKSISSIWSIKRALPLVCNCVSSRTFLVKLVFTCLQGLPETQRPLWAGTVYVGLSPFSCGWYLWKDQGHTVCFLSLSVLFWLLAIRDGQAATDRGFCGLKHHMRTFGNLCCHGRGIERGSR
jgi:succinate-acetate transporter protein